MISSLLYHVGLRPRVYYTLTNFRGGGKAPVPPLNTPMAHNPFFKQSSPLKNDQTTSNPNKHQNIQKDTVIKKFPGTASELP